MTTVNPVMKILKSSQILKCNAFHSMESLYGMKWRGFADKPKSETSSKLVVVHGADNEERLRVRRARPADTPRVLRFVRENAKVAWPGFVNPQPSFHVVGDYVARALAQGHSMVAEQQEPKRGWCHIRGLALNTTTCPWDAAVLDKWARCVRCKRSKQLVHFTAHCLRAPGLHDKYRVHNILQVILIVPPDGPRSAEIIHMLAKHSMKRGKDVGLPVLRFDVTNNPVAKALEQLDLKKEWELSYNLLPNSLNEKEQAINQEDNESIKPNTEDKELTTIDKAEDKNEVTAERKEHFIAVYTTTNHKIN